MNQAEITLELSKLASEQFKDDTLSYFAESNQGRFGSLNQQQARSRKSRRQEREIELLAILRERGLSYDPPEFEITFAVRATKSAVEVSRGWKQGYTAVPVSSVVAEAGFRFALITGDCPHTVRGSSFQEASDRALAEHREKCL